MRGSVEETLNELLEVGAENRFFTKRQRNPSLKKPPPAAELVQHPELDVRGEKAGVYTQGIAAPPAVIEATAQYRHDGDRSPRLGEVRLVH